MVIGLGLALLATSAGRGVRAVIAAYVEFIRNVPLLLLVYLVFYGIPSIGGFAYSATTSFVATLSVYAGAYLVEVFRAGLDAMPKGLIDAGKAIGLTPWQRVLYVRLPTMFRIVLPSLSNAFISLFKDTSIASVIAVPELTYGAKLDLHQHVPHRRGLCGGDADVPGHRLCAAVRAAPAGARASRSGRADDRRDQGAAVPLAGLAGHAGSVGDRGRGGTGGWRASSGSASPTGRSGCGWPIRAYSDVHARHAAAGADLLRLLRAAAHRAGTWATSGPRSPRWRCSRRRTCCEVARGALQSIHPGQNEAGKSIGLTFGQRMLYVVFPQALRRFLPPWINTVVDTVKGSALLSLVGIVDLMLVDPAGDRTHLRADAALCARRADLLRDQLRAVLHQPPARSAVRLYPGIGGHRGRSAGAGARAEEVVRHDPGAEGRRSRRAQGRRGRS